MATGGYKHSLPLSNHIPVITNSDDMPVVMSEELKNDILKLKRERPNDTDHAEIINKISSIISHFDKKCTNATPATIVNATTCVSRKKNYQSFFDLYKPSRRGGNYSYRRNATRRRNQNKHKNKSQRHNRKNKQRK